MAKKNQFSSQNRSCISKYAPDESGALFLQFDAPIADYEIVGAVAGGFKEGYIPLKTVEKFTVANKSVAWIDNASKQIVVDSDYFSDLKIVDVTRLTQNEVIELGIVKEGIFEEWSPRDVISFLLSSQLLNTYWHTGAELCLIDEQDSVSVYRADFDAMHTYFTNERNVEAYSFAVKIDRVTGVISILGK